MTPRGAVSRRAAPPTRPSPASGRREVASTPATPRWPSTSARRTRCGWACGRSSALARRRCASSSSGAAAGYDSVRDLWLRGGLSLAALERLADADAFRSLGLDRREALWAVRGAQPRRRPGRSAAVRRRAARARRRARREAAADAARRACGRGLPPPVAVAEGASRSRSCARGSPRAAIMRSDALDAVKSGERVDRRRASCWCASGPGTAKGVIFMTLEDEAGVANIIVWPKAFERLRAIVHRRALRRRDRQVAERGRRHPCHRRADGGSDADARPAVARRSRGRSFRLRRSAARRRAAPPGRPLRPDAALLRPAPARRRKSNASSPARCRAGGAFIEATPERPSVYATSSGAGARLSPTIIARTRFSRWRRLANATPARWTRTSSASQPCAIQECRCCAPDEPHNASVVRRVAARNRRGDDDQQRDDHRPAGRIMADETAPPSRGRSRRR